MTDEQIQWASKQKWYVGHGVNANNIVFIRVKYPNGYVCDLTYPYALSILSDAWAGY